MPKIRYLIIITFFILVIIIPGDYVFSDSNSELIIHLVEAFPNEEDNSYEVKIHLSVVDDNKKPIKGLQKEDFKVKENSKDVEIQTLDDSDDEPINMIILMDITGSMSGRIRSAKESINSFVNSLGKDSQVAIYTFGKNLQQVVGLSSDLDKVVQTFDKANILAINESACIFDAAYKVAEIADTLPQGRRVVVLLTDSQNTSTIESGCSFYTLDDVIAKATQSEIQIPFYPIGVGANVDESGLQRLAARTGGIYHSSIDNIGLLNLLSQINETLSSEYIISYKSQLPPGKYSLSIGYGDLINSKSFNLPSLPPLVEFQFPQAGQEIHPEIQNVIINIVERGIPFANLSLMINERGVGAIEASQSPYQFDIDFSEYESQEVSLSIILFDVEGRTLTSVQIPIKVLNPDGELEEKGGPSSGNPIFSENSEKETFNLGLIAILAAVLLSSFILIIILKKRKPEQYIEKNVNLGDATLDGFEIPSTDIVRITVLNSDELEMIGKEFLITKPEFKIGRNVDNDLSLPKDSAVSRYHVSILINDKTVKLQQKMKSLPDGTKSSPTYGTYINDRKVTDEVVLNNGDEISLGKRTKLRVSFNFRSASNNSFEEGMTFDGYQLPDLNDDSTLDG